MSSPALPPLPLWSRLRSNLLQAPLVFLATGFFGGLSLLASCFEKRGRVQHAIARRWARVCLWVAGARVTVIGRENLRPLAVYASNHASFMDTPLVFSSLPFQFRILAKQSLWSWPFIGWHLKRSGQIPVAEEETSSGIGGLTQAVRVLRSGMPLFIFPEGGRTSDGQLQSFMNGPAFMAIRAKVPLIPIALIGTYELLPIHTHHLRPRPVKMVIGEPIDSTGYTIRQTDQLTARLYTEIAGLCSLHDGLERVPGKAAQRKVISGA